MRKPRRSVAMPTSENSLQYSCVEQLLARKRAGVWFHHSPNECIREESAIHQYRMGCVFGFWDLVVFKPFRLPGMAFSIDQPHWFELKVGENKLTDKEQKFRAMLFERKARHKVCRDIDSFVAQCLEWELIK